MGTTVVTRNYQVTLPKDVRMLEDIHIGDSLQVVLKDDAIELRKISPKQISKYFGIWKESKETSVQTVKKIREEGEQRLKRLGL